MHRQNLFRNRSSGLVVSNMITLLFSFVSVSTNVKLILGCAWSSQISTKKRRIGKQRIFYVAVVNNKVKCYTMRYDEMQCMIFFYLVYLVIIVQRCCLISLYWLKIQRERKTQQANSFAVKVKRIMEWAIWLLKSMA